MASVPTKISKAIIQEEKDCKEPLETPPLIQNSLNAPKHGTVIPNRIFVGGISSSTTESDLMALFSNYGTVTGAKIIADRAGVSKGYGFVTFETEEEARRLQKDADNIVLRERRLNIAPAIKKQGYGRPLSYEYGPITTAPVTSQIYRQNGIAYTFHNGMAFFPQPAPQPLPPTPMDPSQLYQQQGGPQYAAMPQGNPAQYQYPYSQGQVIYQAHPHPQYQYQPISYEGCYDSQIMMPDGNIVVPQYFLAPQDLAYYQPAPMHPQDPNQPMQPQVMYTSPRAYDPAIVYTSEPASEVSESPVVQIQEADTSAASMVTTTSAANTTSNNEIATSTSSTENANKRGRETPVVSLLKVYNDSKENGNGNHNNYQKGGQNQYQRLSAHPPVRRKPRQYDEGRRPQHLNNNNNNPDATNRNLVTYYPGQRGSRRGSAASGEGVPNSTPPPYQQPGGYPAGPRPPFAPNMPGHFQRMPPPTNLNTYYNPPPPQSQRTRNFFHRPRYGGPVGGRGGARGGYHSYQPGQPWRSADNGKWSNGPSKEEQAAQQTLTPPITPKSESGKTTPAPAPTTTPAPTSPPTTHQQAADEIVKTMQTVTI